MPSTLPDTGRPNCLPDTKLGSTNVIEVGDPGLPPLVLAKLPFRPSARSVLAAQAHRRYELDAPLTDDELASIRRPTLILIGEDERLYNPAASLERARLLMPSVEAKLVRKHPTSCRWSDLALSMRLSKRSSKVLEPGVQTT